MPPPKGGKGGPKMVPAKGSWQNPSQKLESMLHQMTKIEHIGLGLKEYKGDMENVKKEAQERAEEIQRRKEERFAKMYDTMFHFSLDFDPKKKREDRTEADIIRNRIYYEERRRSVPLTTSKMYGRPEINLELLPWENYKRMRVMDEVYRRFRVNMFPGKKLPPKVVQPCPIA